MMPMCNELMHYIYLQISDVAQSCYSVIGDKSFLSSKAKFDSVTLYSLDRSLPNLV